MEVTATGLQTVQKARGETVKLGCTYTLGPQDTGELDIEWSNVNPDITQRDRLVGSREDSPTTYRGVLLPRYHRKTIKMNSSPMI